MFRTVLLLSTALISSAACTSSHSPAAVSSPAASAPPAPEPPPKPAASDSTTDAPDGTSSTASDAPKPPPARAMVVKVYDGDTVTLATGDRVRLRWVNTPELKPAEDFGVEAGNATRDLLLNKEVDLSYGSVVRDGYGRLIGAMSTNGQDLSLYLLERGLGHVFLIPPVEVPVAPLLAAQESARRQKLGIWSTDRYTGDLHITSFHANAPGDDRENVNGEYLRVCNVSSDTIDLKGYKLVDISGQSWDLPELKVPPGYTFTIHSGVGENNADLDEQLTVYLQSDRPVWNNKRDRASLYNPKGELQDSVLHHVKGY